VGLPACLPACLPAFLPPSCTQNMMVLSADLGPCVSRWLTSCTLPLIPAPSPAPTPAGSVGMFTLRPSRQCSCYPPAAAGRQRTRPWPACCCGPRRCGGGWSCGCWRGQSWSCLPALKRTPAPLACCHPGVPSWTCWYLFKRVLTLSVQEFQAAVVFDWRW
jgi:hypothetical protein